MNDHLKSKKRDAGKGSKAICRVGNVLRSPSPDSELFAQENDPGVNPKNNIAGTFRPELLTARRHLNVPTEPDFFREPRGDAEYAWKVFGGLSLADAFERYLELPESYQEAFMWMLPTAFEYYFPVVDRYLRHVDVSQPDHPWEDGCQAWILGRAVEYQFHWKNGSLPPAYVVQEIEDLSRFVQRHLAHFSEDFEERMRIEACWQKLDYTILNLPR